MTKTFNLDKFLTHRQAQVEAINFSFSDMRTGERKQGTFYYLIADTKPLEEIQKYGYQVQFVKDNTIAKGTVDLAELFGKFVNEGGLE